MTMQNGGPGSPAPPSDATLLVKALHPTFNPNKKIPKYCFSLCCRVIIIIISLIRYCFAQNPGWGVFTPTIYKEYKSRVGNAHPNYFQGGHMYAHPANSVSAPMLSPNLIVMTLCHISYYVPPSWR